MNDFDVVTGPSPGGVAVKIAVPVPARDRNNEGERSAVAPPQIPETAREASTPPPHPPAVAGPSLSAPEGRRGLG